MDEEKINETYPKVIKRDGRLVEFNEEKFRKAIRGAMKRTEEGINEDVITKILDSLKNSKLFREETIDVELIQDFIENELMKSKRKDAAKSYIIERKDRDRARDSKSKLIKEVSKKLSAKEIVNQNANVDEASFGGRVGEASRVVTKEYALNYCMSKMARENHITNRIYIHDLDSYAIGEHNCLSIPFDDLLKNGFNTRQTDVRPANSVNTAFQLVAVIFQLQSLQQFGGVSATHIDWTMVPYVKKSFKKHMIDFYEDVRGMSRENAKTIVEEIEKEYGEIEFANEKLRANNLEPYKFAYKQTEKEVYQAAEGMFHNLNTLQSRSGNQLNWGLVKE